MGKIQEINHYLFRCYKVSAIQGRLLFKLRNMAREIVESKALAFLVTVWFNLCPIYGPPKYYQE